jgi:hypothetical protein
MESDGLTWEGFRPVLTKVNIREGEISSIAMLTQDLYDRGFKDLCLLQRNPEGKYCTRHEGRLYVYTPEIEGDKLRLRDVESGAAFAKVLGRFHAASEGYTQQPGFRLRVCWGKRVEKYRILTSKLEKYSARIKKTGCSCQFESCTMEHIDELLYRARTSMKVLKSTRYLMALERSMRERQICLNTISGNTMRLTDRGPVIMNVFEMGYNMIEEDLGSLIKKVVEQTGDKDAFGRIMEAYTEGKENMEYSIEIIRALASFPCDSLRIVSRYMRTGGGGDCPSDKYSKYAMRELKCNLLEV